MSANQHQIANQDLSVAIRGRLSAALDRMRDLHRGPTDRELAEELSALQYRGSRWGRRLQRIEQQGLLTMSARGLYAPARLLEDVVLEFDSECLRECLSECFKSLSECLSEFLSECLSEYLSQ